jgi:hypothetical protein
MIVEAEKSWDLPSASWKPMRADAAVTIKKARD